MPLQGRRLSCQGAVSPHKTADRQQHKRCSRARRTHPTAAETPCAHCSFPTPAPCAFRQNSHDQHPPYFFILLRIRFLNSSNSSALSLRRYFFGLTPVVTCSFSSSRASPFSLIVALLSL